MKLDPPNILPCIVHIMRMIFAFYSAVSHFDLPGPRYAVAKAQNSIVIVIV